MQNLRYGTSNQEFVSPTHMHCLTPGPARQFRANHHLLAVLVLSAACVVLSACSAPGTERPGSATPGASDSANAGLVISDTDRAIIEDHLEMIEQVFNPVDTTLQITNSDTDARLNVLTQLLADKGYGIQRVSADQGANFLSYDRERLIGAQQEIVRFTTQIGTVEISRDYETPTQGKIVPASPVRLSGSRASLKVDQSSIANKEIVEPSHSTVSYIASLGLDEQAPVISLVTPDLVDRITSETVRSSKLPPTDPRAPTLQALNSNREQINNLFYADASTFSSLLNDYGKVDRQIIVFGNDSLVLGNTNKSLINQFVDSRVRQGDIISLVGCSNGHTALDIGNEGLALGRAKRVTEELLARGIGRDRILDEGCWAPVSAGEKYPARGVVMELWRRNT